LVAPALQLDHAVALPHRMTFDERQPTGLGEQVDQHDGACGSPLRRKSRPHRETSCARYKPKEMKTRNSSRPDAPYDLLRLLAVIPPDRRRRCKVARARSAVVSSRQFRAFRFFQLLPLTRKITGRVKLRPSSATAGGGCGTGSERRTILSAASSKA